MPTPMGESLCLLERLDVKQIMRQIKFSKGVYRGRLPINSPTNFADSETLLFQTEIFQHKLQIETQVKSNFRINQKAKSVGNKCASACVTDVAPICHATGKGKMAAQIFSS